MASLTLKGIPDDVLRRLRERAAAERRSLNQEAIRLLEAAVAARPVSFSEAHAAFVEAHGPPPFADDVFDGLRADDGGREPPFREPS